MNHTRLFAAATLLSTLAAGAAAQSKVQRVEPPTGVVTTAQAWLSHQEWFCLPAPTTPGVPAKRFEPNQFAIDMASRINAISQTGYEPIAFNQVSIGGQSCFLATFKAPKQK